MNDLWKNIDINCDLGEGIANESDIMNYITSCNIACGGHFGDRSTFKETARKAFDNNLKIGIHPSYPDKINFGRKSLTINNNDLISALNEQIELGLNSAEELNIKINHIKLHGALYNDLVSDFNKSNLVLDLLKSYQYPFAIYAHPNSQLINLAKPFFEVVPEAFIDRNYNSDGTLARRTEKNALIENSMLAWKHLERMVEENRIMIDIDQFIPLVAKTYCIHGDNDFAIEILKEIQNQIAKK